MRRRVAHLAKVLLLSDSEDKRPAAYHAALANGLERRLRWALLNAQAKTPREEDALGISLEEEPQRRTEETDRIEAKLWQVVRNGVRPQSMASHRALTVGQSRR